MSFWDSLVARFYSKKKPLVFVHQKDQSYPYEGKFKPSSEKETILLQRVAGQVKEHLSSYPFFGPSWDTTRKIWNKMNDHKAVWVDVVADFDEKNLCLDSLNWDGQLHIWKKGHISDEKTIYNVMKTLVSKSKHEVLQTIKDKGIFAQVLQEKEDQEEAFRHMNFCPSRVNLYFRHDKLHRYEIG